MSTHVAGLRRDCVFLPDYAVFSFMRTANIRAANIRAAKGRGGWRWALLIGVCIAVVALAATLGGSVPISDLWSHDLNRVDVARRIFWRADGEWGLRPTRILAGLLVGACLAASGAALQAVFRNPLAEPYLLGTSAGGALGATLGLAWQSRAALVAASLAATATNATAINAATAQASLGGAFLGAFDLPSVLAFCGSLAATVLVYALGQRRVSTHAGGGGFDRASLLLSGVAISSFLSALMSLVVSLFNRSDLARQVMFWLLGGLTNVSPAQNILLLVSLCIGLPILFLSARDLNALRLGDEEARALGVSVGALHRRLLVVAALMSSAAVASAGLIGFVGLLAPHLLRGLFGSDARTLAPASALGGAALLVGCDAVARSVARPQEIPVGIITALLGVPLFLALARRGAGA